ncbi:MAG: glycosyltransferase [Candidatus Moranbacteria bacterium]|nr:glycosyltransferase [Candidatus Moranbacteria bacterium]
MRIAIFTNNYLPNPYGVSGSVESFRKEFEKLGHEVYVFAPHWKGFIDEWKLNFHDGSLASKSPRVFRYPSFETNVKIRFPLAIPYSGKIDKILEDLDLDIIHSQHPNLLGSAAMKWAKKKNIPLVFTWHTLYDQYAHFAPFVPRRIAAWWTIRNARIYANRCDAVITPTPSVIEIIRKWGVTNKNITAIPTGVEENQFADPDRKSIREKYNIQNKEVLLILFSRLTAEKNVEFLLGYVIEILKNNPKAKFLICGEGDLRKKLEEQASKSAAAEKIFFAGLVPDDIKKNYFSAGDIFVYASKSETQGMSLTEAMYTSLPIVAVRATGVQDIVEDGRTGFLVSEDKNEFQTAVEKLIDNESLRNKFGEEAKQVARKKYTSLVCAKKMLEVYNNAIETRKGTLLK